MEPKTNVSSMSAIVFCSVNDAYINIQYFDHYINCDIFHLLLKLLKHNEVEPFLLQFLIIA